MKIGFLSINRHPSTILHASPGKCWLTLQARLVCGLTHQPVTLGFRCKPFDLSCLGHHGPRELQAIPSLTREGCSLTSSPLESSQVPRLAGFVLSWPKDLERRIISYKARERVLLRRTPLHCLPFLSTELFVAHPLSSPPPPHFPPAAAGSLPCLHSSLRNAYDLVRVLTFYLQPLLF